MENYIAINENTSRKTTLTFKRATPTSDYVRILQSRRLFVKSILEFRLLWLAKCKNLLVLDIFRSTQP